MTVYVNTDGKKFKDVGNLDEPFRQDMYDDLANAGLKYYYADSGFQTFDDGDSKKAKEELLSYLAKMPFKLQNELCNELLVEDGVWNECKIDYYQNYLDFLVETDRDYESLEVDDWTAQDIQEEYLACLKSRQYDSYVALDSPMSYFESINSWSRLEVVLDFFEKHLPNFKWWYVTGSCQGDVAYVWTFDTSDENFKWVHEVNRNMEHYRPKNKYSFKNYLETLLFGSFVEIRDCDENGEVIEDGDYSIVADLYIADTSDPYYSDQYVNEYMKDTYAMNPAEVLVTYR